MNKVLICTNHFYPETFRCNDVAFELAERGYDVDVLTAIPDYPQGKYHKGYGFFKKRKEKVNGVNVYRAFIIPRGVGGVLRLALNYFSFLLSSIFVGLFLCLTRKYDKVIVHETSPIFIGVAAVMIKKIKKIPMYFWVLDLWPESMISYGRLNSPFVFKRVDKLTRWIYKNSTKILISSRGFKKAICDKGIEEEKIEYFPNWADRQRTGVPNVTILNMPDGFILMFAGNVGTGQNFEALMKAAKEIKDHKDIHFVVIGDGSVFNWVEEYVKAEKLEDTVHLLGRYPSDTMPAFYEKANAMIVSLTSDFAHNNTLPAKVQGYMNAHKPILGLIDGEAQIIIEEAECGFFCNADDYKGFADLILKASKMPKSELVQLGNNGYDYGKRYFDYDKCMNHIENIINN